MVINTEQQEENNEKILQITNYMHPNIGGIEQVTRDIAKSLAPDESIQQKIICFNSDARASDISPNYIDGSPYLSRFREKCRVIPDCIAEHKIKTSPEAELFADRLREKYSGKTLCFAVGRHVPYKGFRYLIEAAKKPDDSYVVCIGGSGPLTEELKKQAEGCENIVFTGKLNDDELKGYYLACDIFCFSSITKNEAYGLAPADAITEKNTKALWNSSALRGAVFCFPR